jgi:hypothetical protein
MEGEDCMDDFECEMNLKCWYPTAVHSINGTKQCMKAYGLKDGSKIGYVEEYHEDMKFLNYYSNGRVCKSMFAVPSEDGKNIGVCSSFGLDQGLTCPVFKTNSNNLNRCKYTFKHEGASIIVPCDCSFMGGNNGRCPIASN